MENLARFFNAIKTGEIAQIETMLNVDPKLAQATDEEGVSAILTAVYYGQPGVVEVLIRRLSQLDIWEAEAVGDTKRVDELLAQDGTRLNSFSPDGYTPLGLAAFFGYQEVLEGLVARGADVNLASHNAMQVAPLHSAAAHHDPSKAYAMMETLLENGADANAIQSGGWSALHEAAGRGEIEMVRMLLRHGARKDAKNDEGTTPRTLAEEKGYSDVANLL